MGMQDRPVVTVQPSLAERLSRWITDPVVSTILLLVGIAGVAIELFIPGFGLPGILGVAGFGLYFFGHYIAGFAGIEDILLFVIGVVLLVIEVFVSSFGILGIAGIACLFSGVVLAAYNTKQAALSLGLACLVAAVIVGIAIRYFGHKGVWNRFVLKEQLSTEKGYISNPDMSYLLGQKGTALTPLRPAGAAMIGDQRIDVVTRGEFIDRNRPIAVIQIEGTRVVVKEDLSKEE
jgi:membrane-bound serine protease (ClpP class)